MDELFKIGPVPCYHCGACDDESHLPSCRRSTIRPMEDSDSLRTALAAEREKNTAGPDRVLRCAFCGFAYPDGTPTHKHESLAAHIRECKEHPVGRELRLLQASFRTVESERDALAAAERERDEFLKAEHDLSDAYLRLRGILKAFDTPYAPSAEQVWQHVEERARSIVAERDAAKAVLAAKESSK